MELIPGTRIQEIIVACREVGLPSSTLPTRSEIAAIGEELLKLRAVETDSPPGPVAVANPDSPIFRDVELPLTWCP